MSVRLFPTPTRLNLLREANAGNVVEGIVDDETYLLDNPYPARKVTERVREAAQAGWITLPEPYVYWRLTDAGRALLDEVGS